MYQSHRPKRRIIFHVDMNSFYASVEMAQNPDLRGKPLAVAGNVEERKGIIVTCSYEAREKGVKTTMPLWQARKLCPNLIVVPPDFETYKSYSSRMFQLLQEYTEWVEPVSIDEGYMDVTECESPLETAEEIQQRLLNELKLPCSIGIGPNKFLAKMASDMKKPLGITVLRKRDLAKKLWPLKVGELHGIGKKTEEKLNKYGIITVKDLAEAADYEIKQRFGINGLKMKERANGIDPRPVDPSSASDFRSIGSSTTLSEDINSTSEAEAVFQRLSEKVMNRLKTKGYMALTIAITIRYSDRKTITRSKMLLNATQDQAEISKIAIQLFRQHWNKEPVRLLGITASEVVERENATYQLDLFSIEKNEKQALLHDVLSSIERKHGEGIIKRGKYK
ncbi:DNA polymerase IV [Fictibacillus phosphorivorans]|uniref:DNA polymerase IV n=1 Tax=Fictibacillus phosphorivorans TaxID=1221500 RepID=UPI002040F69F|nr:DNA polymerase IV [Fictibacillus phosphorivorans]MCM3720317.1 DNA polymerase IV [Fictibacillus phosphorivorans]MCM3778012.1 DNA polymerase IV [Fictibacillus phosphorivorans]